MEGPGEEPQDLLGSVTPIHRSPGGRTLELGTPDQRNQTNPSWFLIGVRVRTRWLQGLIKYSACYKGLGDLMGSCQNSGPLLGPLNTRFRIILRAQKETIILTTNLIGGRIQINELCALSGPVGYRKDRQIETLRPLASYVKLPFKERQQN